MQVTTKSALPKVHPTKNFAKAIKQPTSDFKQQAVPLHLQAVLNASDAVLEPPRAIAKVVTTQVSSETQQTQQARITASEFNTQGNLVLTYSDGTKVVSKNKAPAANSFSPAAPSAVIKVNMINL